jgi:hypothetical protein
MARFAFMKGFMYLADLASGRKAYAAVHVPLFFMCASRTLMEVRLQ